MSSLFTKGYLTRLDTVDRTIEMQATWGKHRQCDIEDGQ